MTKDSYEKASRIQTKIKEFQKLRDIANEPYKGYFLVKKTLGIESFDKRRACLCDEGLTNVIRDYCDKRIKELHDELDAL